MKRTAWVSGASAIGLVAALGAQSCSSSEFTSCADTFTCAPSAQAGSGGDGGATAGASGDATSGQSGNASSGQAGMASGGAGTSGSTADGGSSGTAASTGTGGGDTTAPTVVSISPADLSTGVASNAPIQITFSETMNTASASQAVQVSSFTSDQLVVTWDATGRVLTVTPTGGLTYATGSTLASTTAQKYTVTVGSSATDLAGNALAAFSSSFTTLRTITQVIPSQAAGEFDTYAKPKGLAPAVCPATDPLPVTTWQNIGSSGTSYVFVPFDISALGSASLITSVLSATFVAAQAAPTGDFYSMSNVALEKVAYQAIDKTILSAVVTDNIGVFATSTAAVPSYSVLAALKSDLAAGTTQELYRLGATLKVASDDITIAANFTCSGFFLNVVFLAP